MNESQKCDGLSKGNQFSECLFSTGSFIQVKCKISLFQILFDQKYFSKFAVCKYCSREASVHNM